MSLRRIGVLFKKEWIQGSKSYFFIFSVLAPLVFTLLLDLVFGTIFSTTPRLGVADSGQSRVVDSLKQMASLNLKAYSSESELKKAVGSGARDLGIVLPSDFDSLIEKQKPAKLTVYIWGESILKNRALIMAVLYSRIRDVSGRKVPLDIIPVPLGEHDSIPWQDRFLPVLVLMAIFISGFTIPSSSLVGEKQKGTIGAVLATPATQIDVFISKGLTGLSVSMVMGAAILLFNHVFTAQFGLILLVLFLGAVMASVFGLLLGSFVSDISSLYSAIKGLGIFIYGPGVVALFPQIPKWAGKLFPTYYVMNPIMEIARNQGTWSTVKSDIFVCAAILAVLIVILGLVAKKIRPQVV